MVSNLGIISFLFHLRFPLCICTTRHINIPGLTLFKDFITKDEEIKLINFLDNNKWKTGIKRRVQHYGYEFDYNNRTINR